MTKKSWEETRQNLISAVGKSNYTNWIEPLEFARIEGGVARFHVPTTFMGNWVLRNFGDHILRELTKSGNKVTRVEFAVPETADAESETHGQVAAQGGKCRGRAGRRPGARSTA